MQARERNSTRTGWEGWEEQPNEETEAAGVWVSSHQEGRQNSGLHFHHALMLFFLGSEQGPQGSLWELVIKAHDCSSICPERASAEMGSAS